MQGILEMGFLLFSALFKKMIERKIQEGRPTYFSETEEWHPPVRHVNTLKFKENLMKISSHGYITLTELEGIDKGTVNGKSRIQFWL